jgi:serine/threonine-protein kinase
MSESGVRGLLQLCQEALARQGAARETFLDEACAGDPDLRRAAEALLAEQSATAGFLATLAWTPERPRLAAGTRLGPYEIQSFIGAGGMGEVYKGRDTRLGRTAAIKVLPPNLAADPDRRRRFEQEARAVSALNHPNICTLHDIGSDGGTDYLVMEHLEGQTLAECLAKGPIPVAQALEHATQIADALAQAHRKGIVHRDLKPGNVMITKSGAKLLDFGLAKLRVPAAASGALSSLPTRESSITAQGAIVGTLAYMAPEQLEGKDTDVRSDIFSFGALLYEMLTGKRAFRGDSHAGVIAAILTSDPLPLSTLQPVTPPALDRLVRKCLAKDPDERWQSASDLADQFKWMKADSGATMVRQAKRWRRPKRATILGALGVFLLVATIAAGLWTRTFLSRPVLRLIDVRPAEVLASVSHPMRLLGRPTQTSIAISPDGRRIYFSAAKALNVQIYVRALDADAATPVAGTEAGVSPFLSPDGQWLGFWADNVLRKMRLPAGPVIDVCPTAEIVGAFWIGDGRILSGRVTGAGILSVPDGGGQAKEITTLDRNAGEVSQMLPRLLPGGSLLYTSARGGGMAGWKIMVRDAATGRTRVLIDGGTDAHYVSTGHLVFARDGKLFAVPFDVGALSAQVPPVVVKDDVMQALNSALENGASQVAISTSGTLVFVSGGVQPEEPRSLAWLSRDGAVQDLPIDAHAYQGPRLSPDGRRALAFTLSSLNSSIWVYDFERRSVDRLPTDMGAAWPVWSPDGNSVVFLGLTGRAGTGDLFRLPLDASHAVEAQKVASGTAMWPAGWGDDGRELVYLTDGKGTGRDIWAMPIAHPDRARPLVVAKGEDLGPAVSPDGRWLAYTSNVSGTQKVYVRAYRGEESTPVTSGGYRAPAWSHDSRTLFFANVASASGVTLCSVSVSAGAGRKPILGPVETVFQEVGSASKFVGTPLTRGYDVSADGRFLMVVKRESRSDPTASRMEVVENWFEELMAKVPVHR